MTDLKPLNLIETAQVDALFPYSPEHDRYEARQRLGMPEMIRGLQDRFIAQLAFAGWLTTSVGKDWALFNRARLTQASAPRAADEEIAPYRHQWQAVGGNAPLAPSPTQHKDNTGDPEPFYPDPTPHFAEPEREREL